MIENLSIFLKNSLTAYHACDNAKALLEENGFLPLSETEDWNLAEGGKYYITRGGSAIIAFCVGSLDDFSYKIVASHTDSPALKLKSRPVAKANGYATLNVEKYGGGIWYSFFDRPLAIAGRVVRRAGNTLQTETVTCPFRVVIPSVAVHQNRGVNDGFAVNPQVDLQPLCTLTGEDFSADDLLKNITGDDAVSYDLYLVNADMPYTFGAKNEFLASPRIDNLTGVYSSLQALISANCTSGVCVAACLDNEEVGSLSAQGADGDFLENVLRRIAYAFRFDDNEYYKALASSFLLSVDNGHAVHPNHPEKSDPTNRPILGGGVLLKSHANRAYITDAMSLAVVKSLLDNANVPYQEFFNRSDAASGSTLGSLALRHVSVKGADIGVAQLAMHSACECMATEDFNKLCEGLKAYYSSTLRFLENGCVME